jgi:hypothetical protein
MKRENKKKPLVCLSLCVLALLGCEYKARNDGSFPKEKEIVFTRMNVGENMGQTLSIESVDSFLLVTGRNMNAQVLLINKHTKEDYMFGETGEGPGRFLQASNIIPIDDRNIGIYDVQKRALYNFNIDSVRRRNEQAAPGLLIKHIPDFTPIQINRLGENKYVAIDIGATGLNRFVLLNADGGIISKEGALPKKKHEEISDAVHAFAYWGKIATNPEENKVAIATLYAGMIQVYDCSGREVKLIGEHNLFLADYNERDGNFAVDPQTRWGYLSIDANSSHIFALYSGLNQVENPDGSFATGNVIHVFDWNGNPVARLVADRRLDNLCVDETTLYGHDGNAGDIVQVRIKDLL